ncbi:MAG: MutS-related protein [Ginsengibacter sp.]
MEPKQFYRQRIVELNEQLRNLKKKKSAFAWLRLGSIIALIASFYFFWSLGTGYVIIASVILLIVFIRLIKSDLQNQDKIDHSKRLIQLNENEVQFLNGNYFMFPEGSEHVPKEHTYANDLDIFGHASLFQYLNRTSSEIGSATLAAYLKSPAAIEVIEERQNAVKELSKKAEWIKELQSLGTENKITFSAKERLENWIKEPPVFSTFQPWKWLRYLLPAIVLTVVALYIFDEVGNTIFYGTLLLFAVISYQINKYVAPVHNHLSKLADELSTLSSSVSLIEDEKFESPLLQKWQSAFLGQHKKASYEIGLVKKILDKLDLRYNLVLSLPLNLLLLWNLQQILDLEKWKETETKEINLWFETLAQFEALGSFGILLFNRPHWQFPSIKKEYFSIKGKKIGHPLIPDKKRVTNFIDIPANGELMLVTGSNMAGKSTYLRSIGVNFVLAMAGAPVCASSFSVSHAQLISSMRVTDNLEESTSTFYAELKKLKTIIDKVNAGEKVFILLDEILRGTNSLDRHTGSKALIKQLINKKAAAIIATHDLELATMKEDYSNHILNYHFDVQVSNDELFFDYRLKPGVCNSLNASILMKKIGIEL